MFKKRLLIPLLLACFAMQTVGSQAFATDSDEKIGALSYIYGFPMVLMEITRRSTTNVEQVGGSASGLNAPMNQFSHVSAFPDHTFTDVVRPNADTLYSSLWFDVTDEPLVLANGDTQGRYYMFPLLDMWTDVFACPGARTTGTAAQTYAIVGPNWKGELPEGVEAIRSPTSIGWIIGRTQTNGKEDYDFVHKLQASYKTVPLSHYGDKNYVFPKGVVHQEWDRKTPPLKQVLNMSNEAFFTLFAELLKNNPPHEMDWDMVAQMKQIGIVAGESLDYSKLSAAQKEAIDKAVPVAKKLIAGGSMGEMVNGWSVSRSFMGSYGVSYLHRATIAMMGLGANLPKDAVYPITKVDSDGNLFTGASKYVLHFTKEEVPPVSGFWSLTMYNDKMLFVDNPIQRYAIGDRDKMTYNADGSLDIYIQHDSPGKEKEANWLPAPEGSFDMLMRLYWPDNAVLTGEWNPPAVKKVE